MIEGICGECLWYREQPNPVLNRWIGFCRKQGSKRMEPTANACESLRAWHIPEHVTLFNKESILSPVS